MTRPRLLAAAAVLAALAPLTAPAALAQGSPEWPAVREDLVVTTDWLAANLERPEVVVLHIASPHGPVPGVPYDPRAVYDSGHIPGARFVPWKALAVTRSAIPNELPPVADLVALVRGLGIDERSRVVLYGPDAGLAASRAFVVLDYLGLGGRAALLDGQWKKWQAEGRPVSKDAPEVEPSRFEPRLLRPEIVLQLPAVRDLAWAETNVPGAAVALLDSRPEAEFRGEKAGEGVPRPGHIPGAASVFWQRHVASPENPILKPIEELRALYAAAGVRPGDVVVAYCRTGAQASHTYFVARRLGLDVRLYDGSFTEWSRAEGTPIER